MAKFLPFLRQYCSQSPRAFWSAPRHVSKRHVGSGNEIAFFGATKFTHAQNINIMYALDSTPQTFEV